jgi:hypothetical protein
MAVGEAVTNIAAADIASLKNIKLSANWMAAAGYPGEGAALYDTVKAVALDLCPALGIAIPVGKDSLSMKTAWLDAGAERKVVSPISLVVSAFAPVEDVRRTLTPQLRLDRGATRLLLVDLGAGRNRLGGSCLAQVYGRIGSVAPDCDDPLRLRAFFDALAHLRRAGLLLAYHDRSDGGLFVTLCEHALKHSFAELIHLTDLELASRGIDWSLVDDTARRWGLEHDDRGRRGGRGRSHRPSRSRFQERPREDLHEARVHVAGAAGRGHPDVIPDPRAGDELEPLPAREGGDHHRLHAGPLAEVDLPAGHLDHVGPDAARRCEGKQASQDENSPPHRNPPGPEEDAPQTLVVASDYEATLPEWIGGVQLSGPSGSTR